MAREINHEFPELRIEDINRIYRYGNATELFTKNGNYYKLERTGVEHDDIVKKVRNNGA